MSIAVPQRAGLARHHVLTDDDIDAVVEVLRSDWITQGPMIPRFEERMAAACGARYAVAFSSGTAALHAACFAAGLESGDEALTTPLTFVASANAAVYVGATPTFADIDAQTLTLDPQAVAARVTARTKAVLPVHFAGLPCAMGELAALARQRGLIVIEDACHALGAQWRTPEGRIERVGSCSHSDMAVFSFHPVKHITTGEGGMVLTNRQTYARRLQAFRHHGIVRASELEPPSDEGWAYEMRWLGYNYRLTDFQCALGLRQLERLDAGLERRREIVARYREAFTDLGLMLQEGDGPDRSHAWHLFVIQLPPTVERKIVYAALRDAGVPVNVHYEPVYRHPFYRQRFGYQPGLCPNAERYYERAITLPLSPRMSDEDAAWVIEAVRATLGRAAEIARL